jgi:hypothetical protein
MQRPFQLPFPKLQELAHFRKVGRGIAVLPDAGLKDRRVVGNAVEDVYGGDAVACELKLKIGLGLHASSPFSMI